MRKGYQKQFHRKTKRRVGTESVAPEEAVQLTLDRSEVMREMQEGLHRFGVTIGLELAAWSGHNLWATGRAREAAGAVDEYKSRGTAGGLRAGAPGRSNAGGSSGSDGSGGVMPRLRRG